MQASRQEIIDEFLFQDELEKRECQRSYYEFFKRAWCELEPQTPLKDNWHIQYLCNELQREIERIALRLPKTQDLIINIPPRSAKSYIVSIMLCPWAWTRFPHLKFINSSYSKSLSITHCLHGRRLIESDWYQNHWGEVFKLTSDQNVKSHYENDKGGSRFATSVSGSVTGHGADVIVADDLLDPKKAHSEAYRQTSNDHYDFTLFSRLNDQTLGLRVIVMQRLHEDDTTGHVETKDPQSYRKLCIPAELDEEVLSPSTLREFYIEGLFFKNLFSQKFLQAAQRGLGVTEYAGQYGQRPAAQEGNIFKRSDWRFYQQLPARFDTVIQSWDLAFKDKAENDYVVGQVWGRLGADCYLIAQFRAKVGFNKSLKAILEMTAKYPQAQKKLIEDKANGSAAMDVLKGRIPGIISITPKESKIERAHAVTYLTEGGNVYLPDPRLQSWVTLFIDECANFPNSKYKDQVDAMTQALAHMGGASDSIEKLRKFLVM